MSGLEMAQASVYGDFALILLVYMLLFGNYLYEIGFFRLVREALFILFRYIHRQRMFKRKLKRNMQKLYKEQCRYLRKRQKKYLFVSMYRLLDEYREFQKEHISTISGKEKF